MSDEVNYDESAPKSNFENVRVPEGGILKRKEMYEYTTPTNVYDIELFEHQDGTFYAIGIPREGHRLVVYGSNIVDDREMALTILVDKIRREGVDVLFHDEPHDDEPHDGKPRDEQESPEETETEQDEESGE